jgi:glycosyltransferase involved in cell wall biosynthesis
MTSLTVLTAVYNGMPYLPASVESVRRQTFQDWKLLLINDGSTDGSADYLNSLKDPRIHIVHQQNQGLAASLNNGLRLCNTEFIARFDADDLALPTRFERQLAYLREHPRVGLVGTQIAMCGTVAVGRASSLPCRHEAIDANLMQGRHAICHSSIMYRTCMIREIGGYWALGVSEDWDMYLRMAERAELANVDEVLMHVRVVESGIQSRQMSEVRSRVQYACESASRRRRGLSPTTYDEFRERHSHDPWWRRTAGALETYAMLQYRKAQPEILGTRRALGHARLAWAATCAPSLTWNRISRVIRYRLRSAAGAAFPVRRSAPDSLEYPAPAGQSRNEIAKMSVRAQ